MVGGERSACTHAGPPIGATPETRRATREGDPGEGAGQKRGDAEVASGSSKCGVSLLSEGNAVPILGAKKGGTAPAYLHNEADASGGRPVEMRNAWWCPAVPPGPLRRAHIVSGVARVTTFVNQSVSI